MANRATHVCPWWITWTFDNPLRRLVHDPGAIFGGWVSAGDRVVDIGCGFGHFSLGLARLVGARGSVVAVDLQEEMLRRVRRRAERAGLEGIIRTHRCREDALGLEGPADFVLAFWMVHEVPDSERLLEEVAGLLRPGGRFLMAEPVFHTPESVFLGEVAAAERAGLAPTLRPRVRWSRAALLERPAPAGHGSRPAG